MIEDGLIIGVESAGYEVPADCPLTTFEGSMLPGLFDAHVHLVSDLSLGSLERAGSLMTTQSTASSISRCGSKRPPA